MAKKVLVVDDEKLIVMIGVTEVEFLGAINLFNDNKTHKLVWKHQWRKRPYEVGVLS